MPKTYKAELKERKITNQGIHLMAIKLGMTISSRAVTNYIQNDFKKIGSYGDNDDHISQLKSIADEMILNYDNLVIHIQNKLKPNL